MAELFQVLSTAKLQDDGMNQRWAVEVKSEPDYGLPVHTAVVVRMPFVEIAMGVFSMEDIWREALIDALPDECFPPWAPI
jgi:hypothetical protein